MEPDDNLLPNILILLLLILLNAFFAMSEAAVGAVSESRIKAMARESHKKAAVLLRLIIDPPKLAAAIQAGTTLSGFLASAVAARAFAGYLSGPLETVGFPPIPAYWLSLAAVAIILSYVSLAFGTLVPKRAALQNYEKLAFAIAPALSFFEFIGRPFVFLSSASANGLLRLIGIDPDNVPDEFSEEEIRMMVDAGGERGSIEESEKEMINNIFEFDDRTVDEMMTHRTEIVFLRLASPLSEVVETALKSGYSRIPVCEDDLDSIAGILYVKDLLSLVSNSADDADFSLSGYMREPLYVLESNTCMAVLSEFKAKKIQIAVVVDEYGGTSGLVTMEDLLESIVGNIQDEYDDEEEEEIFMLGENRYLVDGLTSLEDVDKFFGLSLSEEEEFDTIGGYVVNRLGRIPADGEHPGVDAGGYRFIVSEMDERRVARLEVEKIAARESPPENP